MVGMNTTPQSSLLESVTTSVPLVSGKMTVSEVLTYLTDHAKEYTTLSRVYVVTGKRGLQGEVPLEKLYKAAPTTMVAVLAEDPKVVVLHTESPCYVVHAAVAAGAAEVVVLESPSRRFAGVINPTALMGLVHTELVCAVAPLGYWSHIRTSLKTMVAAAAAGFLLAGLMLCFIHGTFRSVVVAFAPLLVMVAVALGQSLRDEFVSHVGHSKAWVHPFVQRTLVSLIVALSVIGGGVAFFVVSILHQGQFLWPLLISLSASLCAVTLSCVCILILGWKLHRTIIARTMAFLLASITIAAVVYFLVASSLLTLV